ncbi:MAG: ABC transporter permease [Ignavibacteriota bacterium]
MPPNCAPRNTRSREADFWAGFRQDVRYAFRTWRKSPGFTALAVLALALGIGANTAIFSVVNGVLLQPLPYPEADRLLKIYESSSSFGYGSVAYLNYLDWKTQSNSFTGMAAYRGDQFNFTGIGEPEQIQGEYVSASLLSILGVRPQIGRAFLPAEDREGAPCSVILSDGFWKRRLGGDPKVLGKILNFNASRCSVVGVLPASFRFQDGKSTFLSSSTPRWPSATVIRTPGIGVVARLRPAVNAETAQAEMSAISGRIALQYPKTNAGRGSRLVPIKEDMVGSIRPHPHAAVGRGRVRTGHRLRQRRKSPSGAGPLAESVSSPSAPRWGLAAAGWSSNS